MQLFGFLTITHFSQRVMTVMCSDGVQASLAAIDPGADVIVDAGPGRLPRFLEKREGALQQIAQTYDIQMLDRVAWEAKKAELGEKTCADC